MLPVTVVTGFLGAGKTTLVNRWLSEAPRGDVAVIVNEVGAIGIDGALLAARATALVEIAGGCVCCRTQEELVRALETLAESAPRPSRVLVETSGAASPVGVLRAIAAGGGRDRFVLDGVVTVVDATRTGSLADHDLAIEQVCAADVIVISRADESAPHEIERARRDVASWNGAAHVVAAAGGLVAEHETLEALVASARTSFDRRVEVARSPRAAHVYESIALVHDGEIDGDLFADFVEEGLARFAGRLLRTKGILAVRGVDERMIVQGIADLVEVTFGERFGDETRSSRFVVVGFGLDRSAIEAAFRACAAAP